jgi:hypothetical protein
MFRQSMTKAIVAPVLVRHLVQTPAQMVLVLARVH